MKKSLLFSFFSFLLGTHLNVTAQDRFSYSGNEVLDSKTGLIWQRCTVGKVFTGNTCSGTALVFTHEAALVHARINSGSLGWRLPNIKELSSIVDLSRISPAIDILAFPGTPQNNSYFWSSTPDPRFEYSAWVVDFGIGGILTGVKSPDGSGGPTGGIGFRTNSLFIRLVR